MLTFLLFTLQVERGHTILVHAAAGGVGSLLCQWANALGATVIGTVSNKEKAAQAKEDGCHHVIIYKEEDFVARVNEITSGNGVEVVYDSVGKDTFEVVTYSMLYYCIPNEISKLDGCVLDWKSKFFNIVIILHRSVHKNSCSLFLILCAPSVMIIIEYLKMQLGL